MKSLKKQASRQREGVKKGLEIRIFSRTFQEIQEKAEDDAVKQTRKEGSITRDSRKRLNKLWSSDQTLMYASERFVWWLQTLERNQEGKERGHDYNEACIRVGGGRNSIISSDKYKKGWIYSWRWSVWWCLSWRISTAMRCVIQETENILKTSGRQWRMNNMIRRKQTWHERDEKEYQDKQMNSRNSRARQP